MYRVYEVCAIGLVYLIALAHLIELVYLIALAHLALPVKLVAPA